jgi:hypothetical protein
VTIHDLQAPKLYLHCSHQLHSVTVLFPYELLNATRCPSLQPEKRDKFFRFINSICHFASYCTHKSLQWIPLVIFIHLHGVQAYVVLFSFADIVFLQTEGLWQPCVEQVYRHHLSNSMCSLRISMAHFGDSCNISNFFIIVIYYIYILQFWRKFYYG